MEYYDIFEIVKKDSVKAKIRHITIATNAIICSYSIFGIYITNQHYQLILSVMGAFWIFLLLDKIIPTASTEESRKQARTLAFLFFIVLVLNFISELRNGVLLYSLSIYATFFYQSYFYGEPLSKDMLKIGGVLLVLEILVYAFSILSII